MVDLDTYEQRHNLYRYKEAKEELENQLPEYIDKVGEFQYNNKQWRIADHFVFTDKYGTCGVCGNRYIREVFVVENAKTRETMPVGNICINSITNTKIADWYSNVKTKLDQLEENRLKIDLMERLLDLIEVNESPISISRKGIKRLENTLDRMCKGWKPKESQLKLWHYYQRKWYNAKKDAQT